MSNIAIAKPENARRIEDILITNAQRGAINEKVKFIYLPSLINLFFFCKFSKF